MPSRCLLISSYMNALIRYICWLPSHVVWLWTNYFRSTWRNTYSFYYVRITAHVLSYANSSMNPIIYAFLSSRFRREFQRAIRCRRPIRGGTGLTNTGSRVTGSPSGIGATYGVGSSANGGGIRRSTRATSRRDRAVGGVIALVDGGCSNSSAGVQRPAARCYHFQRNDLSRMTATSNTSAMTMLMPTNRHLAPVASKRNNHTHGHDDEDDDAVVF